MCEHADTAGGAHQTHGRARFECALRYVRAAAVADPVLAECILELVDGTNVDKGTRDVRTADRRVPGDRGDIVVRHGRTELAEPVDDLTSSTFAIAPERGSLGGERRLV